MPSRGEKIIETLVLGVLNIALPSADVNSDLGLIYVFYRGSRENPYCDEKYPYWRNEERLDCYYDDDVPTSNVTYTPHYGWGTMMLLPFLLNYLISWYVWAITDKRKAVTWVAALLSFYPQFVALKIIRQIWVNPKRGLQKKRHLERDLSQIETFWESVPSVLIMSYLTGQRIRESKGSEIIFNHGTNYVLFLVAISTSTVTTSLGLSKNLKVGPCRILHEQRKNLKGLLSPRFVLIFFACGLTLVGKGVAVASSVAFADFGRCSQDAGLAAKAAIVVSTVFLPGFLLSLFSCWHRGILKTFLAQPSIFLLPVFSHFTFVSNSKLCGGGGEERGEVESAEEETFITFSPKYTAVNVCVSIAGFLASVLMMHLTSPNHWNCFERYQAYGGRLSSLLGLLLTLVVAFSNNRVFKRFCCASCSLSQPFEVGALLTSSPHTPYILGPDGQLVKEGGTERNNEEEMEVLEMKESKENYNCIGSNTEVQMEA